MDNITLVMITLFIICATLIIGVLNFIQSRKNKKIRKQLEEIEIEKNKLSTSPIIPELAKVESFLNNEKLEKLYNEWTQRLENIKEVQIPKLSDMIMEAEYSLDQLDYKSTTYKIAKLEMELYKVRTSSEFLLGEIKDLTSSEERSRTIITSYKARYRTLYEKYVESKSEYGDYQKVIDKEFDVIAKRFEDFESIMDNNEYTEVNKILEIIDGLLNHMEIVIEEVPSIVLMTTSVLPKRIGEVQNTYKIMKKDGYPLEYLNIEYNIKEADKKITEIDKKTNELNMDDSLEELKVLLEYFDSLFEDFEKEKVARASYNDKLKAFVAKLNKINEVVTDIYDQLDEITKVYNLQTSDLSNLNDIRMNLERINSNYKSLKDHTEFNNNFAFSKLVHEVEGLSNELAHSEVMLDEILDTIGNMHDDEVRARQQLEEIKVVLKDAKMQLRDYNLPVVPEYYYTELEEANMAIREIVKELDKTPITIEVLNTRVDTARDLVLKLYTKTKDLMKNAAFAEMAIVYGNRYRSEHEELNKNLYYAEKSFNNGEYKKSLEYSINSLNRIEPGIYEKLSKLYTNN